MEIISKQNAKEKGLPSYFTGVPCSKGHLEIRSVSNSCCYECRRQAARKWVQENKERDRENSRAYYRKNKQRGLDYSRNWIIKHPLQYKERMFRWRTSIRGRSVEMLNSARFSARKKGLAFDLDLEWLIPKIEYGKCELTDTPFNLTPYPNHRQNPYTASLDRIIPEKGYVKENVRVILWALNMAFNTYGENVYIDIARIYLKKQT